MKNDSYSLQESLIYAHRMAQLTKAIWKRIEKDWQNWIKPFNLNLNEHHILLIAYHLDGVSISEISKFGIMHVSTAFNFSKKLETRGLVVLSKRAGDKRSTYVELTDEGKELFIQTMQAMDPDKNSLVDASLPLKNAYGKFPEFQDLESIVKELYGEEYLEILERSLSGIEEEY